LNENLSSNNSDENQSRENWTKRAAEKWNEENVTEENFKQIVKFKARLLNAEIKNIDSKYYLQAVKSLQDKKSLYIQGKIGCGKTYFAAALIRDLWFSKRCTEEMINRGKYPWQNFVVYHDMLNLLQELREIYQGISRNVESAIIDECSNCDILFIDDFGIQKVTEWNLSIMDQIINNKYNNYTQLILTSNIAISKVAKNMDERIASRISEMSELIYFDRDDRRVG